MFYRVFKVNYKCICPRPGHLLLFFHSPGARWPGPIHIFRTLHWNINTAPFKFWVDLLTWTKICLNVYNNLELATWIPFFEKKFYGISNLYFHKTKSIVLIILLYWFRLLKLWRKWLWAIETWYLGIYAHPFWAM